MGEVYHPNQGSSGPVTDEVLKAELTRPIIAIGNRTPHEAFDIMCDRINGADLSRIQPADDAVVERVARAIALAWDIDPHVFIGMHGQRAWEKQFHAQARAAIAALASPQGEKGE